MLSSAAKITLIAMLCGVLVAASDLTVVTTILPQIIFDLEISLRTELSQAVWIVNAYLIAYTITLPFMGSVSDHFGRRNSFLLCLLLFSIGSWLAGTARSLEWMIAGRTVQALGAGAMVPVTMAFIADQLSAAERPFALGLISAIDTAGWVIGPLYGAAVVLRFHWSWIFFVNIPLSIISALILWRYTPVLAINPQRSARTSRWDAIDWTGALLLSLTLIGLTLAASGTQSGEGGSIFAGQAGFNPYAIPLLTLAGLSLILFIAQERRAPAPLIPLHIFADRAFSAACVANFLVGIALMSAMVNIPIFINIAVAPTLNDAPLLSGSALALFTGGMVLGSLLGGWLTGQRGYRLPAWTGLALAAIGFALMNQWRQGIQLTEMIPGLVVCGVGFGFVVSPLASAAISAVGENQRGMASALVLIMRLIGMALGLAALTTWAVQRLNELSARLPPSNLTNPTEAARVLFQQALLISVQVIDEIFLLTAAVCLIACVPVLWMRAPLPRDAATSWLGWR